MKKFGLLLVVLPLIIFNCTDKENNKCTQKCDSVKLAPKELLEYFIFNKGSYWVYKLNGTDTTDTLTFAGFHEDHFELKAGCNYGMAPCQKRYRIAYYHSNLDKFPVGTSFGKSQESYSLEFSSSSNQWMITHTSDHGGAGSLSYFLAYPFEINQQFEQFRFLKNTSSSLTVPAGNFQCLETEMRPKPVSGRFYQSMHWGEKTGLIRYEISPNKIWALIYYHLN